MSLVGSLEDLGLGDILQIICLSGKSGVLHLRADSGEGRILFDQGRIRISHVGPTAPTLESLGAGDASPERLEELLRQQIEESVLCMFSWASGEFSFEVGDVAEHAVGTPCLDPGLNPQFLALEGTRLADERAAGLAPDPTDDKTSPPASTLEPETPAAIPGTDDEPIAAEPLLEFEPFDEGPVPGVELLESVGMAEAERRGGPPVVEAEPWAEAAAPLLGEDDDEPTFAVGDSEDGPSFAFGDPEDSSPFLLADDDGASPWLGEREASQGSGELEEAAGSLIGELEEAPAPLIGDLQEAGAALIGDLQEAGAALIGDVDAAAAPLVGDLDDAAAPSIGELDDAVPQQIGELEGTSPPSVGASQAPTTSPGDGAAEGAPEARSGVDEVRPTPPRELAEGTSHDQALHSVEEGPPLPPLVLVDPDLSVVEWARSSLPEGLPAAHLFQTTDQGVQRIRQYLRRAEPPVVVLSASLPADSLSGARSLSELLERLKRQAPQMRVLLLEETGRALPSALERLGIHSARLSKPTPTQLADPRLVEGCERLGREFQTGLLAACGITTATEGEAAIGELREISMRLRDSASGGEVLPQVLDFATRSFSRVALFMIREEEAQGIAQVGLSLAGGPDDAAFRQVGLHVPGSAWLRKLIETRAPLRVTPGDSPSDAADADLVDRLGSMRPTEAWLGPIVSANQVVAFLYADRLPADEMIGDTAALEVVLHHAGLALDRAALERALDEPGP